MRRTRSVSRLRPAGVLAAAVLVASSCSIPGSDTAETVEDSLPTPSVSTTLYVPPTNADDAEETVADLEAQWAGRRAAVVATLGEALYGIDEENVLQGPGRLEVDLDQCPTDWNDLAGVDETTIRIGLTTAQTGPYSSFNDVATGMRAYFDYVNANGGIDGRSLELVVRDDAYDPEITALVTDLLLAEDVFYLTNVGSPGAFAVQDDLNEACVPQPFVVSSHPAWGDPVDNPFTSGLQLSFSTEAILWGNWIKQNLADRVPVTVGALVTDNDFGQVYADAFKTWAAANSDIVSEVNFVTHDPGLLTVAEQMTDLAEANPQVFLSMTAGEPCLSAVREAERVGLTVSALAMFTPSVCKAPESYMAPAGQAADGFLVVGAGFKSTIDPLYSEETFVSFVNEQLQAAGLDPAQNLVGVGFAQYGWAHVELLRVAAALPGGLSRSNVVLAMRGLDLEHPMLLEGVRFVSEGLRDPYFIEGAEYSRYDAAVGGWFQTGPAVDVNGLSPACRWIGSACTN